MKGDGRVRDQVGVGEGEGGSWTAGMLSHLSRNGLSMLAGGVGISLLPLRGHGTGCAEFTGDDAEGGASSSPHCGSVGDLHKLTTDECWRLILKLGTQWPTWIGAATPSQATHENDATMEAPDYDKQQVKDKEKPATLQRQGSFLQLLATRALEALAQTPADLYGGTLASKQKAAGDSTTPSSKAPSSSLEPRASISPRTAALTIFYDGIVNVSDNIPADKARLILMFAQNAGMSLLRNVKCVTPSQTSKPSHGEGSSSVECSHSAKVESRKFTTVATDGSFRHHVTMKLLPNARKNSLARFLDPRKRSRGTAPCSRGGSPKKRALADDCCPSDSDQEVKSPVHKDRASGIETSDAETVE